MRSGSSTRAQEGMSFIEAARRRQIVDAAIATIAELGYGQASLARIAERVGISKGVIGYHFAGKEDLLSAVVAEALSKAEEYMRPRLQPETTGRGVLRAYIESNVAFMGEYRDHMVAIVELARGARRADGRSSFDRTVLDAGAAWLAQLLARFQGTGDFRADFDPRVMAAAIRAVIDSIPPRLANDPDLDVEHYGQELADLFDLATRATSSG